MSESLRDSAISSFNEALELMEKNQNREALEILEKTEEAAKLFLKDLNNEFFQANLQTSFKNVFTLGYRLYEMGRFSQAQNFYELSLLISQKLLDNNPENIEHQSDIAVTLNNLGILLSAMGRLKEARQKCEKALDMRQNLLNSDPENVTYQSDVAMTLNNLGTLLSDMGHIEESKKMSEKVLDMRQNLLNNDPENVEYQLDVAMALNNLGVLLWNTGRIEKAKKRYEKALEMCENLRNNDPENVAYQSSVGTILNNIGTLLKDMGRLKEAKQRYETTLELRQKLFHNDPENIEYQSDVAMTLNNLGVSLNKMGRLEEAKQRYEKALKMWEKLLNNDLENIAYQLSVSMALNNLGALLSGMGRLEEAKQRYEKALELREDLLSNDPENVVYQSYVGTTLNNLGNLIKKMESIGEAKQKYEKALEMYGKLLDNDPENLIYQSYVGTTLNNLGVLLSEMKSIGEAKQRYKKALELRQKLLENDPENAVYQSDVGATLNNLGVLLKDMGHIGEAKQRYEKALELRQKLLDNDPENVVYQSDVGATLDNLGVLLKDMGRIEEAKQRYEKALELRQKLLDNDPENVVYQSDVGTTLDNLGVLLKDMGRIEEAKQRYEKALELRQKLLDNDPENVVYQSDVGITLNNLGNLLSNMEHIEEAKQRYEKALQMYEKLLSNDPENIVYQSYVAAILNNLGLLLSEMECIDEAKRRYRIALQMYEKLLSNDPKNVVCQSYVATTFNNFGLLLSGMGRIEEAKQKYENALEMRQNLLETDPENVVYQSDVAMTLNNLGLLLSDMGRIEEAKQRYENALEIYTEPMQYLTIGKKSHSIVKLIALNTEQAKKGNQYDQMRCLKEAVELCKRYQNFFIKHELKHERELVTGAGLSAYIDFLLKNIRAEPNTGKRADEYEKAIKAVEELKSVEEDEAVSKLCDSTSYYLSGRKLVNEALSSKQPDLDRLKQAIEQFKKATETHERANVCYCVYTGLFEVLTEIEKSEEIDVPRLKKVVEEVTKTLSDDVNPSICASFKDLPQIFEEKDCKTRDKLLFDFLEQINSIEYRPLENLFEYIHRRTKDYFEEPFNPIKLIYENWKLKVIFDDPEKVKGKLTVKAGNRTLFNKFLTSEERENNSLEIDYLEKKYFPEGKDEITFSIRGQKKPVIRSIDYFESIPGNKKIRILQHDCCNNSFESSDLRIAAVQLKYHAYGEDSVVKLTADEAYYRKVMAILKAVKEKADIVVFPEFSIPFEYLEEIQQYADENGIIVVAGSHYVQEKNLGKYGNLFTHEFGEEDLRKNISPIVIPDSKIVHNEKMLAARDERGCGFEGGMQAGEVNHILKLREDLRVGVMICYEYVTDDLRKRLIRACDVILVPQTNPSPNIFYRKANSELNIQLCTGNRAHVMVNGIYTWEKDKTTIHGGSTGVVLTLDKHSYSKLGENETVIEPVDGVMEQFVYIMSINTDFNTSRDTQTGQEPITLKLIHIFEEAEIPDKLKEKGREFVELINRINSCNDHNELKCMLIKERGNIEKQTDDVETSIIKQFSPLTNKHIQKLDERKIEELKEKCFFLVIPNN